MATLIIAAMLAQAPLVGVTIADEPRPINARPVMVDTAPNMWRRAHRVQFCTADALTCVDDELVHWLVD